MYKGSDLNDMQRLAVETLGQPVLIFAGAGSGKTRVLTYKVAYLIEEMGMPSENILAVTFTNKAASEMKNRIHKIVSLNSANAHIGTFHSICAGLLRKHIHHLGYSNDFSIYDQEDSRNVAKQAIKELDLDPKQFQPRTYQHMISSSKNKMLNPEDLLLDSESHIDEILFEIFKKYQGILKDNNAVDFDDLLLLPLELFKKRADILKSLQKRYQYVLVDEYQDTNKPQFEFIYSLSKGHNEITVVGDDDQSIYAWRGADVSNILNFSEMFKNSKIIKLEQNYRSTKNILHAAHSVVKHNTMRAEKELWTDNPEGDPVEVINCDDERSEAEFIINEISSVSKKKKKSLNDFVILYRTNAQSRSIEDCLRRNSMPYHIVGGTKFYERKEIKDLIAYLRFVVNPSDSLSLNRIINFPPKSIGKKSATLIFSYMSEKSISFLDINSHLDKIGIPPRAIKSVKSLVSMFKKLIKITDQTADALVSKLIEEIEIKEHYTNQETPEAMDRVENINEFQSSVNDFVERNEDTGTISIFLEEVALLTDIDRWNSSDSMVTLMTLHSSKGLEFPFVFISGVEEGLIPLTHMGDDDNLDEERRLFYVGVTRAMKNSYLCHASRRRRYDGVSNFAMPSSFIDSIPHEVITRRSWPEVRSSQISYPRSFASSPVSDDIRVNDRVEHKLFGKGVVVDRSGSGESSKLVVRFRGNVVKKLMQKYANLKKVSVND